MLNKFIKAIILLAVFLIPLFYLPLTQNQFQFNKEILFLALMLLAGLLWFGQAFKRKKLEVIRTPLDLPILLVVLVYGLATLISPNWLLSLINIRGAGLPGFASVLGLALFYFMMVNVFVPPIKSARPEAPDARLPLREVNLLLGALLLSSFVVQVISFLSILKIPIVPGQHASFNTLGSLGSLSVFVAITLPLALYFLFKSRRWLGRHRNIFTILIAFYIVVSLITLNTINFAIGWWVATIGSLIFLVLYSVYYSQLPSQVSLIWAGGLILALSLISLISRPPSVLNILLPAQREITLPAEVSLSKSLSRQLALGSSIKDPISFIAGHGPGNFMQVFSQNRPARFNDNILWQVRFNQAGNFFYETIATIGWLGLSTFLILFIFFIATSGFLLFRMRAARLNWSRSAVPLATQSNDVLEGGRQAVKSTGEENVCLLPLITLLAIFISIGGSLWLATPGLSVFLTTWLVFALASIIGILHSPQDFERIELNVRGSAKNSLFISFGLVLVSVLLLFSFVFIGRLYLGEVYYKKALTTLKQGEDTANLLNAQGFIKRALNNNQKLAEYYMADAQISLVRVRKIVEEQGLENTDAATLERLLAAAINQSKKAVDLKPNSVSMWENRGVIFESVSQFTTQARIHAINSFKRAIELEPTNPILYYKLGDNQRLLARRRQQELGSQGEDNEEMISLLQEAQANLEKAIELKSNYLKPRLSLVKMLDNQNKLADAIGHLKAALQFKINQDKPEVYYEVARLMYNKVLIEGDVLTDKFSEILPFLDKAIVLWSNYSNALYTRALVYRRLEEFDRALADMELVARLNPENREAQAKLQEVEALVDSRVAGDRTEVAGEPAEAGE